MNRSAESSSIRHAQVPTLFAVDDDESDRLLFLRAIGEAQLPYSCRMFSAGDYLLDALIDVLRGAPAPVACFVDVKMAGMSGLDVLRWIRAQHGLDALPVIMLSSSEDPQFLAEAQQFGAQCYAAKFPAPEHMREIVNSAKRFSEVHTCSSAFALPCNLLLGVPAL